MLLHDEISSLRETMASVQTAELLTAELWMMLNRAGGCATSGTPLMTPVIVLRLRPRGRDGWMVKVTKAGY
jgi:hypothetical protein